MTPTLFASFMGHTAGRRQTVAQLLAIYRDRCARLERSDDHGDDLRVGRFIRDMSDGRWRGKLVMRIGVFDGEAHLIDGTHRGIAYLACLQDGVGVDRLPAMRVDR